MRTMELVIDRKWKTPTYTISNLTINGEWFCNVLEDKDRNLDNSMTIAEIVKTKVPSSTAIPRGTYEITLDVYSPKFGETYFYKKLCNGKLPRLLNVKGFEGVLIHSGNTDKDTNGCLLVGYNTEKGKVLNSQDTFRKLYNKLLEAKNKGEKITIKIL